MPKKTDYEEDFSTNEIIVRLKDYAQYLRSQILLIIILTLVGAVIGFCYALMQPTIYTAKTTFVVEDSKSFNSFNGLASIAGQFGVDIGEGVGSGLVSGENILLYLKSSSLIQDVLLRDWDSLNKVLYIDIYLQKTKKYNIFNGNNDKKYNYFKNISINYTRERDSIIQSATKEIIDNRLEIYKVDKKSGFIQVNFTMEDEIFAKKFSENLLETGVEKFIRIKTKKQQQTVNSLQIRADSLYRLLNTKSFSNAGMQIQAETNDLNPLYGKATLAGSEINSRDKGILAVIYTEVVKNLELAKFTLSQEVPVIQIVDKSKYPLEKNTPSKFKYSFSVSFLFLFTVVLFLTFWRWISSVLDNF